MSFKHKVKVLRLKNIIAMEDQALQELLFCFINFLRKITAGLQEV